MSVLIGVGLNLSFGSRKIIDDIHLNLSKNTISALVGLNGSGKSTLLKCLAGLIELDSGDIILSKESKVSYLAQDYIVDKEKTILEEALSAFDFINPFLKEKQEMEDKMRDLKENDDNLINNHFLISQKIEELNYYNKEALVYRMLLGLGFSKNDFNRLSSEFSGGYQMRIALAKVLLGDSNILLLDEPTNYLDIEARSFLKDYLRLPNKTIILVSHDKEFLNALCKSTFEIKNGELKRYAGSYDFYIKQKALLEEQELALYKSQQSYIEKQTLYINKFRSKATKSKSVQSRIKALERIDLVQVSQEDASANIRFNDAIFVSNKVISFSDVSKSYDDNKVFSNLNFDFNRYDKLAIVGKNGLGKTTILKLINQEIEPSSGSIYFADNLKIGYFSQLTEDSLNPNNNLLQELESIADISDIPRLRSLLGSFLFTEDDVFKKVSVLSGGERSRLALAKILLLQTNLLVLDEPTNHLDMQTKDKLLSALKNYTGSIILVSHDSDVLKAICNRILYLQEEKDPIYLPGGYDYFDNLIKAKYFTENTKEEEKVEKPKKNNFNEQRKLKNELNKTNKEITNLESKIQSIEDSISKLEKEMNLSENYSDIKKYQILQEKENSLKEDLNNTEISLLELYSKVEELEDYLS